MNRFPLGNNQNNRKKINELKDILTENNIQAGIDDSISNFTTFKIGGNADILIQTKDSNQLQFAIESCKHHNIPMVIIGKGSNILVSDKGFRGAVIINKSDKWEVLDEKPPCDFDKMIKSRLIQLGQNDNSLLNNDKKQDSEPVIVRIDSGMLVSSLRNILFKKNIYGLEWFAGIPSTVGGALYVNMHGGKMFFSDLVLRAKIIGKDGIKIVDNSYFKFDYDYSYLKETKEYVIWVDLVLTKGNIDAARKTAKTWTKQKSNQPQRSAGCIFQNLSEEEQKKLDLPTPSIGYVIDKVLGLKGYKIGDARIANAHAAFIENTGNATSKEVIELIDLIRTKTKKKLGVDLDLEIEFIGEFDNDI